MSKKQPKVWGGGTIRLNGVEIDCFVLVDGTALISRRKILKVLGRADKGDYANEARPAFLAANNLQQFITSELEDKLKGIELKFNGIEFSAFHADILPLICDVYLSARTAQVLQAGQLPIAENCEKLVRTFAKVGIVALIHEQLGFEKFKHPDALKQLVESYLEEEARAYSQEFPDDLFKQMDRIYGNERTTSRNRPLYYANFIRKYIYKPLLKGEVLEKLDAVNPTIKREGVIRGYRKNRHHSHTSEKIGLPALRAQIWQVVGILKTSPNKRSFENNYERLMGQTYQGNLFDEE